MESHYSVDINASHDTVWEILSDVVGWSRWMPGMTSVEMIDRADGEVYDGVYLVQRAAAEPSVWFVQPAADRSGLDWENSSAVGDAEGHYRIEDLEDGTTRVHIVVGCDGSAAPVAGAAGRSSLRDGVADQAVALRSRCQVGVPVQPPVPRDLRPVSAARGALGDAPLPDGTGKARSTAWGRRGSHEHADRRVARGA